jgi:hypothetical protein
MKEEPQLIDVFAMFAMQGLLTAEIVGEYSNEHVAGIAYRIADAMMDERQNYVLPSCNQRVNKPRGKKSTSE